MRTPGLTIILCLLAATLHGQVMRPFSTFRQLHGETRLTARLEYGAGTLRVEPGEPNQLYRMILSFDDERFVPVSEYDAASRMVVLGLQSRGDGGVRVVSRNQLRQAATISISPRVDLSLHLNLGAVDADLELGGLRISELDLGTGASQTTVRFSRPNPMRCRRASLSAGAAEVTVLGLGNSRCEEIFYEGGVGKVVLDFSGASSTSARIKVKMTVGGITLRLPARAGVSIKMDKFLSSFESERLERRGTGFVSANYDSAERRLEFDLTTAMGGVDVEWVD